jgi:integrase
MKNGMLPTPMSDRAVELLTQNYAEELGVKELTPRLFRHSAVLKWHQEGLSRVEIQDRLGLKTDYAFRVYHSLFKKFDPSLEKVETQE